MHNLTYNNKKNDHYAISLTGVPRLVLNINQYAMPVSWWWNGLSSKAGWDDICIGFCYINPEKWWPIGREGGGDGTYNEIQSMPEGAAILMFVSCLDHTNWR